MSSEQPLVDVSRLSKRYEIYATPRDRLKQMIIPRAHRILHDFGARLHLVKPQPQPVFFREFWALHDVSFQVHRGETLGIIGRNGSGKSTLLQILAGTMAATSGSASVSGRVAALLELGSGFNPEFTGRENMFLNGRILGLTEAEIRARSEQIVAFADIGEFIDRPVKTYSSGMFVRLAFAVQAHVDANIVIIDEALAVGDVFFTQKCYERLYELVNSGAAVILVTHDLATVTQFCDSVLVLDQGRTIFHGEPVAAIRRYMSLQRSSPDLIGRSEVKVSVPEPPTPAGEEEHQPFRWPPAAAFLDTGLADIVGAGQAEFLGVAVCSANGDPAQAFMIGEAADFYFSFRLLNDIDVPIGGISLVNDKNIIVHGKNSMQHQVVAPDVVSAGAILRFRQRIVLDLAPGDYTFVVGLATVDSTTYQNVEYLSHEELSTRTRRVLSVGRAGIVSIVMRGEKLALPHHGLANLPGECEIHVRRDHAVRKHA